jgi:hypothetical protein
MLLSVGGPRSPRLRSSKSFLAHSSSREVLGKASSSSEERSTTEIPSKGLPCSYTGDGGLRDETSGGESGGSGDLEGEGGGMEAFLGEDKDLLVGEHEHLVPLLSFIMNK